MNLKGFAKLFGMSIQQLSKFTGYSRTALYDIFQNDSGLNKQRFIAMEGKLIQKAHIDKENEKKAAERIYTEKLKALEQLHKNVCEGA